MNTDVFAGIEFPILVFDNCHKTVQTSSPIHSDSADAGQARSFIVPKKVSHVEDTTDFLGRKINQSINQFIWESAIQKPALVCGPFQSDGLINAGRQVIQCVNLGAHTTEPTPPPSPTLQNSKC